jgi:hypothetical protein
MSNLDRLDKARSEERDMRRDTTTPVEFERRDDPSYERKDWRDETPLSDREPDDISV